MNAFPNLRDETEWTLDGLQELSDAAIAEIQRRQILVQSPDAVVFETMRYQEAAGITETQAPNADGSPSDWVQPTGAMDSYVSVGVKVSHGGKIWENLTPFNVWEPGVSGWREIVASGFPDFVQPTGASDAYSIGNRVTYKGSHYESLINANVWSPEAYPAGWKLIP